MRGRRWSEAEIIRLMRCSDCCIAIGEARKPGQTRLDMLGRSVEMLKELLAQLSPYKISGIVVTITNPADIVAVL